MPVICKKARTLTDDAEVARLLDAETDEFVHIAHPHYSEYDRVAVAGADAYKCYEADRTALREDVAEREAAVRKAGGYMTPYQRDNMLCAMQERHHARGLREFRLSTNIYGWCVERTTNLGGGAHSQTRRGLTKAEAIAWGIAWAKEDPSQRYFTIFVEYLPEGYHTAPEEEGA